MRVGLIGQKNSTNLLNIKEEFILSGHECVRLYIQDFILYLDSNLHVEHRKHNLLDIDIFVVTGFLNHEIEIINTICSHLIGKGKKVIGYAGGVQHYSGVLKNIVEAEIKVAKHIFTKGIKSARDALIEIDHPIMIISKNEKKNWTFSDDWTESYDFIRANKSKDYEFKVLPGEVRKFLSCYIVGDKKLALIEKTVKNNNYNFSTKTDKKITENPEAENIALQAHKESGFFFSRVDIGIDEGKFILVDIFRFPKINNLIKFDKDMTKKICDEILDFATE